MVDTPLIIGNSTWSDFQNPPRRVTATQHGSPIYAKPPVLKIHTRLPRAYPVLMYPTYVRYSAYPPPRRPKRPFRNCNKVLDFTHVAETESRIEPEIEPVLLVPRYHRLQYVPRVFIWDWTVREHLTGLERLSRFLSQASIDDLASGPEAISMFLYTAKLNKIDIGLLDWPQGYWNALYTKERGYHKLVIEMALLKLANRISVQQKLIDQGSGGAIQAETTTDSERSDSHSTHSDSHSTHSDSHSEPESESPTSFASAGLARLSLADDPLISFWDGASDDSEDEAGIAEGETLNRQEWADFVNVSQRREGLGVLASMKTPLAGDEGMSNIYYTYGQMGGVIVDRHDSLRNDSEYDSDEMDLLLNGPPEDEEWGPYVQGGVQAGGVDNGSYYIPFVNARVRKRRCGCGFSFGQMLRLLWPRR